MNENSGSWLWAECGWQDCDGRIWIRPVSPDTLDRNGNLIRDRRIGNEGRCDTCGRVTIHGRGQIKRGIRL